MAGFDGEKYLRLLGERWVRKGGAARRPPHSPVLAAAAAALVAVDAITLAAAQAVVDDYDLYRGQGRQDPVSGQPDRSAAPAAPAAEAPPGIGEVRVVPCERVIDQPGARLTVHYVAFTSHATTIRADFRLDEPAPRQPHPDPLPAWARQLSVTDSQGTTATAVFSGSGRIGGTVFRGQFETDPRLAADTAWIELLGERIELAAPPAVAETWTEPLPEQDPAIRHVWERVATLNDFHDPHLAFEATAAALVAAGALPAGAPVLDDARAALAVLRPRNTAGADPAPPPRDLTGPWPSLLSRWGQRGGPVRTIAVGAVTPPFDGVTAAVIDLESRAEHFGITVELVPGVRTGLPYANLPDQQHLTWWAADDLGNYYLGEQGSWNPGAHRSHGAIGFWPALDRRATRIDLMPTAATTRVIIRVHL
ncbi:MAG TPA: hypothetical protein VFV73_21770 [Streptosporangiaceae bacterium]|nr:hypothetical protein [Streptosporangiaceae bacterium]